MPPLLRIRGERERMSAIERRIAGFLLDNAHLLRDYSSQQLANALGISQSSVVKFSQKLGFKGYPDLKFSIGESLARGADVAAAPALAGAPGAGPHAALADTLWQAKSRAEQATRLLNPPARLDAVAAAIRKARTVFLAGAGDDGHAARAFATRLSLLGILAVHHDDPALVPIATSAAGNGDVLLVFAERGEQPALCHAARMFHVRRGTVVAIGRHDANALRAHADHVLLVSAHDGLPQVELLLYRAALGQLLDVLFLLLCEHRPHLRALGANLDELQRLPGA
ncbi:MAG TPA: MurR/RpiR family transcriptional regulator [Luteimonas sp.]|nr:MurR/RpiR family transcriptional regulator [Luteimonas sp.]